MRVAFFAGTSLRPWRVKPEDLSQRVTEPHEEALLMFLLVLLLLPIELTLLSCFRGGWEARVIVAEGIV